MVRTYSLLTWEGLGIVKFLLKGFTFKKDQKINVLRN